MNFIHPVGRTENSDAQPRQCTCSTTIGRVIGAAQGLGCGCGCQCSNGELNRIANQNLATNVRKG